MPMFATVSLTVLSVLAMASSNALVNIFQASECGSPIRLSSQSDDPTSDDDEENTSCASPAGDDVQYGLWTVSEIRPHHTRSPTRRRQHSHSAAADIDPTGLPSYACAMSSPPPRMGRRAMRIHLGEGEAPPAYDDVVRRSPGRDHVCPARAAAAAGRS